MKKIIFISLLIVFASTQFLNSQNINKSKLDSLFNIMETNNKAMGSLTISKGGINIYFKSIGFLSKLEKKIPANENTKYRIGSVTKMFTAVMIFEMVEEGRIKLENTIEKYFPNLPNAKKITISNLMNHRSGIHNFTDDSTYQIWMFNEKKQNEMIDIISNNPYDFLPDEKASYSNSNYVLLGFILEKESKKSYKEILNERITDKIGLINTFAGGPSNIQNNEAFSFTFNDFWKQEPETNMSIPGGAGCIVSTPSDLTKFIEAIFALKFFSYESLHKMKTMTDNYGMGMLNIPFYSKISKGHNGQIDGFTTALAYFEYDSIAIAYCSNGVVYPFNEIMIGILSILFEKPYQLPNFNTYKMTSEELDKYLGNYSSQKLPLKITITKDKTNLVMQATGQNSLQLECIEKDRFKFDNAGILVEFKPNNFEFTLKQRGQEFLFTKDK